MKKHIFINIVAQKKFSTSNKDINIKEKHIGGVTKA